MYLVLHIWLCILGSTSLVSHVRSGSLFIVIFGIEVSAHMVLHAWSCISVALHMLCFEDFAFHVCFYIFGSCARGFANLSSVFEVFHVLVLHWLGAMIGACWVWHSNHSPSGYSKQDWRQGGWPNCLSPVRRRGAFMLGLRNFRGNSKGFMECLCKALQGVGQGHEHP